MHIFVDASVRKGVAIGCYLILDKIENYDKITCQPISIQFYSNSSTIAEYMNVLHVLKYVDSLSTKPTTKITMYTDCNNLINLINERQYSDRIKKHINYSFYKEIIDLIAKYKVTLIKLEGHCKKSTDPLKIIFREVDKKSRKKARNPDYLMLNNLN